MQSTKLRRMYNRLQTAGVADAAQQIDVVIAQLKEQSTKRASLLPSPLCRGHTSILTLMLILISTAVLLVSNEPADVITSKWTVYRDSYRSKEFKKLGGIVQGILTAAPVR